MGHTERKADEKTHRQMVVEFKEDTGGRDIDRTGGKLPIVRGNRNRQCERKPNGTADFLRDRARLRRCGGRRERRFRGFLMLHGFTDPILSKLYLTRIAKHILLKFSEK